MRQLVEQVLFTSPGERVNLPDFGSGLLQLPFAPNSMEMAAATQFSVQARAAEMAERTTSGCSPSSLPSTKPSLTVTVDYSPLNTDVTEMQTFVYGGPQ